MPSFGVCFFLCFIMLSALRLILKEINGAEHKYMNIHHSRLTLKLQPWLCGHRFVSYRPVSVL